MSKTLAELKEKASRLSEVERAELALSLIESLDGPAAGPRGSWISTSIPMKAAIRWPK